MAPPSSGKHYLRSRGDPVTTTPLKCGTKSTLHGTVTIFVVVVQWNSARPAGMTRLVTVAESRSSLMGYY